MGESYCQYRFNEGLTQLGLGPAISNETSDVPGKAILWLHPFYIAALITASWFPRPGNVGYYSGRFSRAFTGLLTAFYHWSALKPVFAVFKKYGSTCLSSVVFWSSTPVYFVCDADAFRSISNERRLFEKMVDAVSNILLCSRLTTLIERQSMSHSTFMERISYRLRGASGKGIGPWPRMHLTKCGHLINHSGFIALPTTRSLGQ